MTVFYIMAILFVLGVILIALEDIIKINKAAIAVGMSILLWLLTILSAGGVFTENPPHFFYNFIAGKLEQLMWRSGTLSSIIECRANEILNNRLNNNR